MSEQRVSECRSCGAAIIWTKTTNGKKMPVDAEPTAAGNFLLKDDAPAPLSIRMSNHDAAVYTGEKYESHFGTCPQARSWSKRGKP